MRLFAKTIFLIVICIIPAEENVTLKGQPGRPKLRDKAIPTQFSLGPKKQNKRKSSEEVKVVPAKAPRLDHNYTYVNPNQACLKV